MRSVDVGLGVIPADLDESSVQHIDKVWEQNTNAKV